MDKKNHNIIIDEMTLEDLDSISTNLETDFDDFWNYNILREEIKNNNSKLIVAKLNNEIVGFAGISIVLDTAELTNIVVRKNYRGNGISSILLNYIIDLARNNNCKFINLEVNCNNSIALHLYEHFGFKQVGLRKKYYDGQDAILLTLAIDFS